MPTQQVGLFCQVYVDLDDVLAQAAVGFTDVLREVFGRGVAFQDIFSFDLGESFGLSKVELSHFLRAAHRDSVLRDLKPMPGAKEVLNGWAEQGMFIVIVTGRPISTYDVTREWLQKNRIPFHSLFFVRKYVENRFPEVFLRRPVGLRTLSKSPFDVAVEDSPKMASYLLRHLKIPLALFDRPWNKNVPKLGPEQRGLYTRCRDWSEIANWYERLSSDDSRYRVRGAHKL